MEKCLPHFVKYLEDKIKNRKEYTLDKIKEQYKRIKKKKLLI